MRREEKEIKDDQAIGDIIQKSLVCRIGLAVEGQPYIVPVSFGYSNSAIYFHGAREGKKVTMIRDNPNACFEVETDVHLIKGQSACSWGMAFRSVIGYGRIIELTAMEEKRAALDTIMTQYTDSYPAIQDIAIDQTAVFKLEISSMTAKQSGFDSPPD